MTGCTTLHLRDAQDNFNKAAEIEFKALDQSLLSDDPNANPGDALAALNEYRLAHNLAEELIEEKSDELRRDSLLGAAYILNAMALWRISDLEGDAPEEWEKAGATGAEITKGADQITTSRQKMLAVLNQIKLAKENNQITLGTRDRVLHKALYGFYDHDGGRAEKDYADAREWFDSAIRRLQESLDSDIPPQHPIRVYVGSAQLRTLAAWELSRYIGIEKNTGALKENNCQSDSSSDTCTKLSSQREVFMGDEDTIVSETIKVICRLRPFSEKNSEVKNSLTKLLAPIGLISMDSITCP
jgi:tetratricopeptide (TPR) repeat protein